MRADIAGISPPASGDETGTRGRVTRGDRPRRRSPPARAACRSTPRRQRRGVADVRPQYCNPNPRA
ncbi:hypothetical protein E2R23_27700 [Burkholderia pseudomallei]|nr:hypothetical protein BOC43_31425 [Burkholderia pseudomallei]AYE27154.1 hypothetical protein CNX72_06835 [Burkholderia pseudomallei]NRE29839.1 hypothetical protein [Burkholderia pseudomallei]QBI43410.1 hypothetical protein EXY28_27695 [Burkholderia pseudomallei]QBI50086.1 hypothetical protein EXY72_27745 [Burkholderia pseudomallei]